MTLDWFKKDKDGLKALFQESKTQYIEDRKKVVKAAMDNLFKKVDTIKQEKSRVESQLKKVDERLAKTLERIKKLEDGDWNVLGELEKEEGDKGDGKGTPA